MLERSLVNINIFSVRYITAFSYLRILDRNTLTVTHVGHVNHQ